MICYLYYFFFEESQVVPNASAHVDQVVPALEG